MDRYYYARFFFFFDAYYLKFGRLVLKSISTFIYCTGTRTLFIANKQIDHLLVSNRHHPRTYKCVADFNKPNTLIITISSILLLLISISKTFFSLVVFFNFHQNVGKISNVITFFIHIRQVCMYRPLYEVPMSLMDGV